MKKVIRIMCFCALLSMCVAGAYKVLSMKDTMGLVGSSVRQLENTKENTIDVAFVGSSHVFAGIYPGELWREYGIVAFDMSVSSMDMDSVYYYTKNMLKTQHPKYVFVELYSFTFEKQMVVENTYRNMLGLPFSVNNYKLVNAYFGDDDQRLTYQLRWPIIHTRYKEVTFHDFVELGYAKYGRGERYVLGTAGIIDTSGAYTEEVAELDEKRQKWLDDMKALSEEEGFKLVYYVAPYTITPEAQMYINAVKKYSKENDIQFFDFNRMTEEIGINLQLDSSDSLHLNNTGAAKLSRYIGYYLAYDEGLETHKDEEGYEYWELDAAYLDQLLSSNYLFELYNMGELDGFFRTLGSIPGLSYAVSLDGNWKELGRPFESYLELLGADVSEIGDGGVWVKIGDGQIERIADNDDKEVHYLNLDKINTLRISRSEADQLNEIKIDNIVGQQTVDGMNIAVYNNKQYVFLGKWFLN